MSPPINLFSLTGGHCSSFLIISLGRLQEEKKKEISSIPIIFTHNPPLPSAAGRSGWTLRGLKRQRADHNGWPIISSTGVWRAARSERLWRRMDQYTSQFLMRGRIGPSQTDGNPALPAVVFSALSVSSGGRFVSRVMRWRPNWRMWIRRIYTS